MEYIIGMLDLITKNIRQDGPASRKVRNKLITLITLATMVFFMLKNY